MFEKFRKNKKEPESWKGSEGEVILSIIEKPEIVIHKSGWVKGLGIAATALSAGAGAHSRVGATGFGAMGVGGPIGGSRSTGAGAQRNQINTSGQQSDKILADKLILTERRMVAVIDGANVTLEAYYDKEALRQILRGQKHRNALIAQANIPKPDAGEKYKTRTSVNLHYTLPQRLRELGYVDNTYALIDIELRKGMLGDLMGWTFYIEVAKISTPFVMKDSEGTWGKLINHPVGITFSDQIKESVDVAKCDIKVKEDKKQHIDNQQVMADFTQAAQAKIADLKAYAFRGSGKEMVISEALRADFEA